jgi:hypothetical protein
MANEQKQGVVNIHGKQYKTVALRVNEFRTLEKYENFSIVTDMKVLDDVKVICKAEIRNEQDRIVATGFSEEFRTASKINRTSAVENAETSAIGRALACLGLAGEEYASANEVEGAIQQQQLATPVQVAAVNELLAQGTITGGQLLASFGHSDPSRLFGIEADRILNAVTAATGE